MNYLAHALLAGEDPNFLLGNIAADLFKGNAHRMLPESVSLGVLHHRELDRFTDSHPSFLRCLPALYPRHGKYAAVVLDVLFDHLLSRHFGRFCPYGLEPFGHSTHARLSTVTFLLPEGVRQTLDAMIAGNWLLQYGHPQGLSYCFRRLARRAAVPEKLTDWAATLEEHGNLLEESFLHLFSEVYAYSRELLSLQSEGKW